MSSDRTPVVVGAGQRTFRDGGLRDALTVAEAAARDALADTTRPTAVRRRIDACWVVNILSTTEAAPATSLANRLALDAKSRATTTIGGNTPQWLLARACDAIAAGDIRGALIAGGEAAHSVGVGTREPRHPTGGVDPLSPDGVLGDERTGVGPLELAAGVVLPAHLYPWFESVLAASAGRTLDEQREWLGQLLAPMSARAASHSDLAWFPERRSPSDIANVTPENRLIAEPYTKRMNSILTVDQGAALVVLAAGEAAAAGIPRERWVYPWSAASCNEVFFPSQRPNLGRCVAIEACGAAALGAAERDIDDVKYLDLYSCFPCAVQLAAGALGITNDDARGLTLTGGMPTFGGPGNNYTTHAIAMAVGALRADPGALALTTGVGWYMTKHAVGIYGGSPAPRGWRHASCADEQARIDASAIPITTDTVGTATIIAGTIVHDRHAGPVGAPVLVELDNHTRATAVALDPELPPAIAGSSLVGMRARLHRGEGALAWEPLA